MDMEKKEGVRIHRHTAAFVAKPILAQVSAVTTLRRCRLCVTLLPPKRTT
jgi:hypothetical protein